MSLSQLNSAYFWPDDRLAELLMPALKAQDPSILPVPFIEHLRSQEVIVTHEDEHYSLREFRTGLFANSTRSLGLARRFEFDTRPLTIIDSLCRADFDQLPEEGALLYLGDKHGGFFAPETATPKTPCSRCLLLRYISNRQGSPALHSLLENGQRHAFTLGDDLSREHFLIIDDNTVAIPLPDCSSCQKTFEKWPLEISPGPFSALSSMRVIGFETSVDLPQLLWIAGVPTVGFGSSWAQEPESGRVRAVHEALERYSAHFARFDTQDQGALFTSATSDKSFSYQQTYLTEPGSISNGLACRRTLSEAVEDGLREVCERDALARFWLRVCRAEPSAASLGSETVEDAVLEYFLLDSYRHPTVLVVGRANSGSRFVGSSCGELEAAKEKARSEALQIKSFLSQSEALASDSPQTFAEHGALYWHRPDLFPEIKIDHVKTRPLEREVYHFDLTSNDLRRCGYVVVRVIVEGLLNVPQSHRDWSELLNQAPPKYPHPFA